MAEIQSQERPGYYAIIPADVRYDNRLTANAKLLYGEITALCGKSGMCWASNRYLADLYGTSKKTISVWIGQLSQFGYINVTLEYKDDGREIVGRYIQISGYPIPKNVGTPTHKNVIDNNTSINNTSINTPHTPQGGDPETKKQFIEFWKLYPKKVAKPVAERSWKKIKPSEYSAVMNGLELAKQSDQWKRDAGMYIPNPATWLNQRRWEDEVKPQGQTKEEPRVQTAQEALDALGL